MFAVYLGRADQPTDGVPLTGSLQRNSVAANTAYQLLFLSSHRLVVLNPIVTIIATTTTIIHYYYNLLLLLLFSTTFYYQLLLNTTTITIKTAVTSTTIYNYQFTTAVTPTRVRTRERSPILYYIIGKQIGRPGPVQLCSPTYRQRFAATTISIGVLHSAKLINHNRI